MFSMFLKFPRIYYLFINSHLILTLSLNFTRIIFFWRIDIRRSCCFTTRLYQFPFFNNKSSPFILIGERVSLPQWHSRLDHPSLKLVRQILSSFQLPVSNSKVTDPCSACLSSKSKQLPFSKFLSRSTCPLELIYTDVWGPAPICSQSGFKYYVSFLDDFSRYTWLYPISCKGDVTKMFYKFKIYV